MKHQIPELPQLGVKILRELVGATGWCDTVDLIIVGGQLQLSVLPEAEDEPLPPDGNPTTEDILKYRAVRKAWRDRPMAAFEVTDRQRDAVRKCINHFIRKGAIPSSPQFIQVMAAFGIESNEG